MINIKNLEVVVNQGISQSNMERLFGRLYGFDYDMFGTYNLYLKKTRIMPNSMNVIYYDFGNNKLSRKLIKETNGTNRLYVVDNPLISLSSDDGGISILPSVIHSKDQKNFGIISLFNIDNNNMLKFIAREIFRMELAANSDRMGNKDDYIMDCDNKKCLLYFPYPFEGFSFDEIKNESTRIEEYFNIFNCMLRQSKKLCDEHRMDLLEVIHSDRLTTPYYDLPEVESGDVTSELPVR